MAGIPKDPVMLLSYINTQLRDFYPTAEELCASLSLDLGELNEKLKSIGCLYDREKNRYV